MGEAARTVQLSWLPCSPLPSVTHVPLLITWQYCPPYTVCHNAVYGADGGSGGVSDGGGGEGDGGGGRGGTTAGVIEPQIMKPPYEIE